MSNSVLLQGDCLEMLKQLPDNSVDSLITDPPAGIGFMGKAWDEDKGGRKQWIKWMSDVMAECLRVLKPGAHGLVWAIPRTSHWTATALEDAGFEIRDVVTHLFGSGFPKSMDISKAIDKQEGAQKGVLGVSPSARPNHQKGNSGHQRLHNNDNEHVTAMLTTPATPEAKQWQGWGTALKPASEHWVLVRKPCSEKTVAANVKSQALMSYLIKMITPPNGIVLDCFMGSGSTGVSAVKNGFAFIGIEKETEYYNISEKRIQGATNGRKTDFDQDPSAA